MRTAVIILSACGSSDDVGPPDTVGDNTAGSSGGVVTGSSGVSAGGSNPTGGTTGSGGSLDTGGSQNTGGSPSMGGTRDTGGSGGAPNSGGTQSSSDAGPRDGSGGSVSLPDATVLPCTGVVPGSGWQRITPPGDLGDTQAIALDPLKVGTLYIQMHKGGNGGHYSTDGIYKTSDCGSTWNKIPPGRNARDNTQGEVNIHTGSIVAIIVDPVDEGTMYIASNYGPAGIYKSANGGVDWDQLVPKDFGPSLPAGGWFNGLSVDPTDRLHLVGATHTGCTGAYAPNCLAETRDGGKTWRLIHAPASANEQSGPYIHDANTMLYSTGQNGLYLTTNDVPASDAPTWTRVANGANGGDTGLFAYEASNHKYYLGSDFGVLAGSDDFKLWSLDDTAPHQSLLIVGTGKTMFASTRSPDYYTANESNPAKWTKLAATGTAPTGTLGRWLVYDGTHHLLYSSGWGDGLYRYAAE